MHRIRWIAPVCLLAIAGIALGASQIRRTVIAAGAMGATSANLRVASTLGQEVVANTSASNHTLRSGFWTPGGATTAVEGDASGLPTRFALYAAYPNPTRGALTLRYDVPAAGGRVALRVYDVRGRLVRTLLDASDAPGRKQLTWDRRDDQGRDVGAGIFLVKMSAPGFDRARKVIVLP